MLNISPKKIDRACGSSEVVRKRRSMLRSHSSKGEEIISVVVLSDDSEEEDTNLTFVKYSGNKHDDLIGGSDASEWAQALSQMVNDKNGWHCLYVPKFQSIKAKEKLQFGLLNIYPKNYIQESLIDFACMYINDRCSIDESNIRKLQQNFPKALKARKDVSLNPAVKKSVEPLDDSDIELIPADEVDGKINEQDKAKEEKAELKYLNEVKACRKFFAFPCTFTSRLYETVCGKWDENKMKKIVKSESKHIDPFSVKALFYPFCISSHYILIIVVSPNWLKREIIQGEKFKIPLNEPRPCLVYMDSLSATCAQERKSDAEKAVIKSLQMFWEVSPELSKTEVTWEKLSIPKLKARVPQQEDWYNCGFFVLYFIEILMLRWPSSFPDIEKYKDGIKRILALAVSSPANFKTIRTHLRTLWLRRILSVRTIENFDHVHSLNFPTIDDVCTETDESDIEIKEICASDPLSLIEAEYFDVIQKTSVKAKANGDKDCDNTKSSSSEVPTIVEIYSINGAKDEQSSSSEVSTKEKISNVNGAKDEKPIVSELGKNTATEFAAPKFDETNDAELHSVINGINHVELIEYKETPVISESEVIKKKESNLDLQEIHIRN